MFSLNMKQLDIRVSKFPYIIIYACEIKLGQD